MIRNERKRLTSEGHEATSQDWAIARLEGNGYINLLKNKTMKRESKSVRTSPTNSTMRVKVDDGGQSSRWQGDGLSQSQRTHHTSTGFRQNVISFDRRDKTYR